MPVVSSIPSHPCEVQDGGLGNTHTFVGPDKRKSIGEPAEMDKI